MKCTFGTSFPAPENLPAGAAGGIQQSSTGGSFAGLAAAVYAKRDDLKVSIENVSVDRRGFLGTAFAAGAWVLGANILSGNADAAASWQPSVYLGFEPNGTVVITAHRSEMGTGSRTSLPLVVAEELDVDWTKVRVEQAIGDKRYGSQNTDGSCSVRDFVDAMHQAGATARFMLERAAAQKWNVPAGEVTLTNGVVLHAASKRRATLGELVSVAATLPVPKREELRFKPPSEYRYIGKQVAIVDQHKIVTGAAIFGQDMRRPGMLYASIERPPVYDSRLRSSDDSETLKVKGVRQTVQIPGFKQPHMFQQTGGVAVLADSTWAAMQGRKKLKLDWELNPEHVSYSSPAYKQEIFGSVHKPGKVVRNRGNFDGAFAGVSRKLEADYYAPMLAHAPMEPPAAVAEYKDGKVEVWAPVQDPQSVQQTVGAALGVKPEDVTCNVTLLGGGFGRKSKPDFVAEAALLSKATGKPVKVVFSREDDIRNDFYHAVAAMHMKGGIDAAGKLDSLLFRSAFPPIASTFQAGAEYGLDLETGMGLNEVLFDVPHMRSENGPAKNHVRIGWLRAVCHNFHAFALHSFMDELAQLNGTNYVDFFLKSLGPDRHVDLTKDGTKAWNNDKSVDEFPLDTGRLRHVLEECAARSGYAKYTNGKGRGIGIAAHRSFLSYIATAVEVHVDAKGGVTIPNVWTVADIGKVVMPDRVRAQFEGAAVFGTSLAMMGEITAEAGRIVQSNFHNYPVARMKESPRKIDVKIVDSKERHAGAGEPGVPVMAPAIAAAIFAATGKRVRELPIKRTKLV